MENGGMAIRTWHRIPKTSSHSGNNVIQLRFESFPRCVDKKKTRGEIEREWLINVCQ